MAFGIKKQETEVIRTRGSSIINKASGKFSIQEFPDYLKEISVIGIKFRIEPEEEILSQEIEKKNGSACSARNADGCFNRPCLGNEDAYHSKDHENEDYPKSLGSIPGKKLKDWKNLPALGH